jgi:short subunit fatty acids transporter
MFVMIAVAIDWGVGLVSGLVLGLAESMESSMWASVKSDG